MTILLTQLAVALSFTLVLLGIANAASMRLAEARQRRSRVRRVADRRALRVLRFSHGAAELRTERG